MLICDATGLPFYSRSFDEALVIDDALLSGLLSAIGTIGKHLFNQDIATISFGENRPGDPDVSKIVTISKDLISKNKQIFFVFFISGQVDLKKLSALSTLVFMEAKSSLLNRVPEQKRIALKINKIIDYKFQGLEGW
jgi:hypothetical protein